MYRSPSERCQYGFWGHATAHQPLEAEPTGARGQDTSLAPNTLTIRDGAATQGDMFIAPDGSKFAFVRTDPEDVAAGIDPQVTAKRVGE